MATPRLFQPNPVTNSTSSTRFTPLATTSMIIGPREYWVPISQPTRVYWHSTAGALQMRMAAYSEANSNTPALGLIRARPACINGC